MAHRSGFGRGAADQVKTGSGDAAEITRAEPQAALRPSWASEMTSFTPLSPRRVRERRNVLQKVSASDGPSARSSTSRQPSVWATATIRRHRNDAPGAAHLEGGGVEPEIGPAALDRTLGREADHLAQKVRVRSRFKQLLKGNRVASHRRLSVSLA